MPLILKDWIVTTILAIAGIYVFKTLVLTTPIRGVPGLSQVAATI